MKNLLSYRICHEINHGRYTEINHGRYTEINHGRYTEINHGRYPVIRINKSQFVSRVFQPVLLFN